jgi:Na+-transporting NADH:ubiquinone oxidoreductase subunit NqrC
MGSIAHILGTLFKALLRILLVGVICGLIGAGLVYLLSFVKTGSSSFDLLTNIAAIAVGILALYAGGVTVLMIEAVRAAQMAARSVEKEAGAAFKDAGGVVQGIEKEIGKHI